MEIFDAIEPFAHAYTRNKELKVPNKIRAATRLKKKKRKEVLCLAQDCRAK